MFRMGIRRRIAPGESFVRNTTELDATLTRLHLPTVRKLYREFHSRAEKDRISYTDYLTTLASEEVAHQNQT